MAHFIRYCWICKTLIAQCRCPDSNKPVSYSLCPDCTKNYPEAHNQTLDASQVVKAAHELLDLMQKIVPDQLDIIGTDIGAEAFKTRLNNLTRALEEMNGKDERCRDSVTRAQA